jgi:hypothetical protein
MKFILNITSIYMEDLGHLPFTRKGKVGCEALSQQWIIRFFESSAENVNFWFLTFAFISALAKQSEISFHDSALFSCFLRIESTWVQQNNVFSYIILKDIYFLKNEIFKKYSTKFHLSTAYGNFRKNDLSEHSNWRTKNMKYPTATCLINISADNQKHSRCHMKCWNLGFCPGGPPEFQNCRRVLRTIATFEKTPFSWTVKHLQKTPILRRWRV